MGGGGGGGGSFFPKLDLLFYKCHCIYRYIQEYTVIVINIRNRSYLFVNRLTLIYMRRQTIYDICVTKISPLEVSMQSPVPSYPISYNLLFHFIIAWKNTKSFDCLFVFPLSKNYYSCHDEFFQAKPCTTISYILQY